jgi:Spx/MgsR family transcriptional regulator
MSPAKRPKSKPRRKVKRKVKFLYKSACTSCRKAKARLQRKGVLLDFRDLVKHRLTAAEIEKLIGRRDHRNFLNSRNPLYRRKNMKEKPPSRAQAIRMMAKDPNLIRRPVIVAGGRVVVGFHEEGIARL